MLWCVQALVLNMSMQSVSQSVSQADGLLISRFPFFGWKMSIREEDLSFAVIAEWSHTFKHCDLTGWIIVCFTGTPTSLLIHFHTELADLAALRLSFYQPYTILVCAINSCHYLHDLFSSREGNILFWTCFSLRSGVSTGACVVSRLKGRYFLEVTQSWDVSRAGEADGETICRLTVCRCARRCLGKVQRGWCRGLLLRCEVVFIFTGTD